MNFLRQTFAVIALNLRNIPARLGASSVIVLGIATVVAVLVSVLAMAHGLSQTLAGAGQDSRAIILRKGAESESASTLSRATVDIVELTPGIQKGQDGKPLASAELLSVVAAIRSHGGLRGEVVLRGVSQSGLALRSGLRVTEGRMARPGVRELIAGRAVHLQYKNMGVGDSVRVRDGEWTVVGLFESNGDAHESELLADADTMQSVYQQNTFQSVTVLLSSPDSFPGFKRAVLADQSFSVDVFTEREYYKQRSQRLDTLLFFVAYVVGGIMALGAIFGAVTIMYSAIDARRTEIATLRAIGFRPFGVAVSVIAEGLTLALLGALIGASIAWFAFANNLVTTSQGEGDIVFQLHFDRGLIVTGIVWAFAIALFGAVFPAVRAARMQVATALRGI